MQGETGHSTKSKVKKAMNQTTVPSKPSMSMKKLSLVAYQRGTHGFSGLSSTKHMLNKTSTLNKENSVIKSALRNKSAIKKCSDFSTERAKTTKSTPFRQRKASANKVHDTSNFTSVPRKINREKELENDKLGMATTRPINGYHVMYNPVGGAKAKYSKFNLDTSDDPSPTAMANK